MLGAGRHEIRIIIIQTLFENDFYDRKPDAKELMVIFNRIAAENKPVAIDNDYAKIVFEGISSKIDDINNIIDQAASNWSIDKLGRLDKNILVLGVYEILFGSEFDVPWRVAINEALEIAKLFLNDTSRKFINGVLGAVCKEVEDTSEEEHIPVKKIIVKKYVSAVILCVNCFDEPMFAFVHDIFNRWTLSKGSLVTGEELESGLKRVIKEELSIDIQPIEEIGENSYTAHPPEGPINKEVTYFLATTNDQVLKLSDSEGLTDAKWFNVEEIKKLNFYPDLKQIILDGVQKSMELYEKK